MMMVMVVGMVVMKMAMVVMMMMMLMMMMMVVVWTMVMVMVKPRKKQPRNGSKPLLRLRTWSHVTERNAELHTCGGMGELRRDRMQGKDGCVGA